MCRYNINLGDQMVIFWERTDEMQDIILCFHSNLLFCLARVLCLYLVRHLGYVMLVPSHFLRPPYEV